MSEDEENVQNESEEQFKIEDLDDIYKSQDSLENEINKNNIQDDSIEDNANYNYISSEIQINNNKKDEPKNQDIIIKNSIEEINYNRLEDNYYQNKNSNDNINDLENENDLIINKEPEGPINLIEFTRNDFILNKDALNILNSIKEDLIIVAIVGKARTGKSYLMNLLLNNNNSQPGSGFQISSRLNSCTKGIWLWNTPRDTPHTPNTKIIFIDSEGTNSTDLSTKTYDSKIFALIVLISSLFIYNTHGNIDERSIGDLALAAHISNTVATNVMEDKEMMLNQLAPKFIWVLRDFVLDKIDPETGKEISSNEYLEICLRNKLLNKNGIGMENNLIRENIIKYFKERECVTLPRPVDQEEDLHKLDEIPFDKLKPNFRSEFLNLKNKVYENSKVKRIGNKKINGPILVGLLTQFINSLNSKIIPNINTAIENIIINEIEKNYEKCKKIWKQNYSKINSNESYNIKEIYNVKYYVLNEYNMVINENREIKYSKKFLELYQNNKIKLEEEIKNDINKLISNKNKNIKNFITTEIINKYENNDIYSNINSNSNLEQNKKKLILNLLEKNFHNFTNDIKKAYSQLNNYYLDDKILDIILKQDQNINSKSIKEIIDLSNREIDNAINEIKAEIKKEQLFDRSNDINQMNTINETLNTKCDLLNEELDIKEKELSHLIGKYTRLAEKREKILNNLITKKREQNLMTMRSQRNQNDLCGITVEANEKGCGCEIGDFCFIF
jgi:hypothetical protein